ncbi:MAG: CotH kinase family protein [Bacteroidota bacterium]
MLRSLALLSLLGLVALPAATQPLFPEPGRVFDDTRLPRVDITIPPDTLAWILNPANQQSDIEYRARFVWDDGVSRDTVEEIGFRLRGNTSRASDKKSFKVSFNTYHPGRQWEGLDKLNLNGEHNDPTIIRAKLSWDLVRQASIPGSRAGFAQLFINDQEFGVYANIEHIDEEFLGAHFRDATGTLYKCLFPADLDYLGSNPATYRDLAPFGRPVYELVQGEGDHSDLVALIEALNLTPLSQLPEAVEKHLDVNGYLRTLAVDVLIGNWDGYAYNQNNFYLYHDPEIGRFRYLPYDLDNTWGIDFLGRDWGTRDVYDWPRGSANGDPPRPLAKRLLQVPDYRDRFSFYLRRTIEDAFTTTDLYPRINALRDLIEDAAATDPFRPLDYGWSIDDFRAAFGSPLGGHVDYGLRPWVSTRRATAQAQTETVNVPPLLSDLRIDTPSLLPGLPLTVRVWIEDEAVPAGANLFFRGDGPWQGVSMVAEGNGVYAATIGPFDAGETVSYYVEATDQSAQTRVDPRRGADAPATATILTPGGPEGLEINELMASNDATIADEFGEFDDWVEIVNLSSSPVSLGGLFLTDDLAEPDKFALPDTLVPPGGFVLVWADDDDEDQGPMHASFRLSAGGEDAGLFQPDDSGGFTLVSGISFGPQTADVSFGRVTDGADRWTRFGDPTPGASNNTATTSEPPAEAGLLAVLSVAPNPFREAVTVTVRLPQPATLTLDLFDTLGRRVGTRMRDAPAGATDLVWNKRLPAGTYLARIRAEDASGAVQEAVQPLTVLR